MDRIGIIGISLFLCSLLSVTHSAMVKWEDKNGRPLADKLRMKVSEKLTVFCKADGLLTRQLVFWRKETPQDEHKTEVHRLATYDVVEERFAERYLGQHIAVGTDYTFNYTINGLTQWDSGKYSCNRVQTGQPEERVFFDLEVEVEPKRIALTRHISGNEEELQDDKEIEMESGQMLELTCAVYGSSYKPHVVFRLGDKDLAGQYGSSVSEEDIEKQLVFPNEDAKELPGSWKWEHNVTRTATVPVKFSFQNKVLTCEAQNEEGETILSRSVRIRLPGVPPQFTDCKAEKVSFVGDVNVEIGCLLEPGSNPTGGYVLWEEGPPQDSVELPMGQNQYKLHVDDNDSRRELTLIKENGDGHALKLRFTKRLVGSDFRGYYFVATNDIGESDQKRINLVRDKSLEPIEAASSVQISALLGVLVLLLHALWRHL